MLSLGLILLLLVVAPLAVGTVHRNTMMAATALAGVAFVAMALAAWGTRRGFSGARYTLPLALLVGLPLLQLVPLPLGLRGLIDSTGNELLTNAPPPPLLNFPLSLDPITTQIEILRAALALMVFLICLNLSSGRRGQGALITQAVAGSAVLGAFVAIGHPLLNFDRVYGSFGNGGSPTLLGPFVNPNHNAELFELGAFAAVACVYFTQDRLARAGWIAAAALCGAAALVTLSRGSLIGLAAGAAVLVSLLLRSRGESEQGPLRARSRWVLPFVLAMAGLTLGLAVALGAWPIIDELARTRVSQPGEKTDVWFDALHVLRSHPAGIGRGAFDRVYPAYRTLPGSIQQNFIENGALQMLVDLGWFGFALLLGSSGYACWVLSRRRLQDGVEAALLAALAALMAHNLFDFGLETLGLRLPFVALAGVLVGRLRSGRRPAGKGASGTWLPATLAVGALMVGLWGLLTAKPFDLLLAETNGEARVQLSVAAAREHPTDYFFPLTQASAEPLRKNNRSPRLSALNRAMRLCPNCSNVHHATAAALWQLGRQSQALAEYRTAMELDVAAAKGILDELYRRGATHEQVSSLRAKDPRVAQEVAHALIFRQATGRPPRDALAHARSRKADAFELGLMKVYLAFNENNNEAAATHVAELLKAEPRSAGALYLKSHVQDRMGETEAALKTAVVASGYNPTDETLARQRVNLASRLNIWDEVERGLEALKRASQGSGSTGSEAYVLSAQVHSRRGNLPRALRDYQTATSIDPNNLGAWYALAITAENGGFYTQAAEAYRGVLRLQPEHPESRAGLARIEAIRQGSRLDAYITPPP